MQTPPSAEFVTAAAAEVVDWVKAQVRTDWAGDGYDGDATIDDLSDQAGDPIIIQQSLDDGWPNEVTATSGQGVAEATVPLAFGQGTATTTPIGQPLNAAQYFSPFRADSPVYGFDRDIAPITVDLGLIDANGPERVRVFTGQMAGLPVTGRAATLEAVSATRLALSTMMQPPGIWGRSFGANVTWPVVYALHKAGLYAAPPPRSGCRIWMPMCGSVRPMLPDINDSRMTAAVYDEDGATLVTDLWVAGPWLNAPDVTCTAAGTRALAVKRIPTEAGTDVLSQAASTGRVEFYVRGDAVDLIYSPHDALDGPGYPTTTNGIVLFRLSNGLSYADGEVVVGIDSTRHLFVYVDDGSGHTGTFTSVATLATDGAWYCCGAAWDIDGQKLWLYLDGALTTKTDGFVATLVTGGLPAVDDFDRTDVIEDPSLWAHIPVSDMQLTGGAEADPDVYTDWIDTRTWTVGAQVVPSDIQLEALVQTAPAEAWEFLGQLAQGELAAVGVDEHDLFRYLPQSYWAQDAQQTSVDTLSTLTNVGDLEVSLDYTRIRNSVAVTYDDAAPVNGTTSFVATVVNGRELPPGTTRIVIKTEKPIVWLRDYDLNQVDPDALGGVQPTVAYFAINLLADGSGWYGDGGEVTAVVVAWDVNSVTVELTNVSGWTWYLATDEDWPPLAIDGISVTTTSLTATAQDDVSVAVRGERSMSVSAPMIQRRVDADRFAQYLVDWFGKPLARIESATVFGDPRRQPGDLVTFADAAGTGAAGYWRCMSVEHTKRGPEYTQRVDLMKAYLTYNWLAEVFVAAGSGVAGNNASVTPGAPTGVAVGDLVIIMASIRNSGAGTVNTPAGWTSLLEYGNCKLLGRIWQAGDAMPTVTFTGGVAGATTLARAYAFRAMSPDLTTIVRASATQLNGAAQNIAYPALTVPERDCLVLFYGWKQDDYTSVTAIPGTTSLMENDSTTGDDAGQVLHGVVQGAAANITAGSFTVVGGAAAISRGVVLALATSNVTNAATLRSTGTADHADNAPVTPGMPTGWQPGDLLLLNTAIRNAGAGTPDTPDGYVKLVDVANMCLYGRIAQFGDTAPTVTFTGGVAGATCSAQMAAFTGVSNLEVLASAYVFDGAAADIATPALNLTDGGFTLIIWIGWKQDDCADTDPPYGATTLQETWSTLGDDQTLCSAYQAHSGDIAQAAASFPITGGALAINRGGIIALRADSTLGGATWDGDSIWADNI